MCVRDMIFVVRKLINNNEGDGGDAISLLLRGQSSCTGWCLSLYGIYKCAPAHFGIYMTAVAVVTLPDCV